MTGEIITTNLGRIRGFEKDGCSVYLGIPFAKPPVGEYAFKHPPPPEPWEGVLDAAHGSCNPIQGKGGFYIGNNSQDCLYLNVFVPEGVSAPMPVMVWIYGGAYSQGGAGAEEKGTRKLQYDLSRFAKETGCVVVTFNYRLNLYGFLNLHSLDSSFDQNKGLYDQIMALRFVKENIEAFGGDPGNITLFGQSAGGACILALMTMREAEGLFHKSIVQSACIEHFFTEEESQKHMRAYLRYAGVRTVNELLGLDEKKICDANAKYSAWLLRRGDIRCAFSPVIDGVTLPEAPKTAVKKSTLPMLIGNTSQEGNLFLASIPALVLPLVARYIHLTVKKGMGSYKQRICDALTDHIYVRPQTEMLEGYYGLAWRYTYQHPFPGSGMGCFHGSELPVLFGLNLFFGKADDAVSEKVGHEMRQIWSAFARTGTACWPQYDQEAFTQRIG